MDTVHLGFTLEFRLRHLRPSALSLQLADAGCLQEAEVGYLKLKASLGGMADTSL